MLEFVRTSQPIALGLTEAQWVGLVAAAGAAVWLAAKGSRRVALLGTS